MLDWLRKKPQVPTSRIRDTLFGDMPLAQGAAYSGVTSEPWASFERAGKFIESGDREDAIALQHILGTPEFESRHNLQAYHLLRGLGVSRAQDQEKQVLGVVVEAGMKDGTDLVAGYADRHARYYNYSGAAVVWERPNNTLDEAVNDLLEAGSAAAKLIGPWKKARPPAPTSGRARVNLLTPNGLHFGEGLTDALARDKVGGPVMASAFRLMQRLTTLSKK